MTQLTKATRKLITHLDQLIVKQYINKETNFLYYDFKDLLEYLFDQEIQVTVTKKFGTFDEYWYDYELLTSKYGIRLDIISNCMRINVPKDYYYRITFIQFIKYFTLNHKIKNLKSKLERSILRLI